jgi:hypothetical protein
MKGIKDFSNSLELTSYNKFQRVRNHLDVLPPVFPLELDSLLLELGCALLQIIYGKIRRKMSQSIVLLLLG